MKKLKYMLFLLVIIPTLEGCRRDYKDNSSPQNQIGIPTNNFDASVTELESVNFYLENSGSMNGYANGNTDFKRTIAKLLYDLERKVDEESIKINTINTIVIAQDSEVSEFAKKLQTDGIPKGGDQSNSDINHIFDLILKNTQPNQISILVTDAIYSIEQKGCEELIGLLEIASNETLNTFYKQLQNSDLSTLIIKMSSNFNGLYYPAQGGSIKINQDRPYYLWFFGNSYLLKKVYNDLGLTDYPGYMNDLFILKTKASKIEYTILEYGEGVIGEFHNKNAHVYPIHEIEFEGVEKRKEPLGEFGFAVAMDLSKVPLPETYLIDLKNYKSTSDKYYPYDIKKISEQHLSKESIDLINSAQEYAKSSYTHILYIKTKEISLQSFSINLTNKLSNWANNTSLDCDDNIKNDGERTFGFKQLTTGILNAYKEIDPKNKHISIELKVTN